MNIIVRARADRTADFGSASSSALPPRPGLRRERQGTLVGLALALILLVGQSVPASADAGSDLSVAPDRGPVGTAIEVRSLDVFDMNADMCPGPSGAEGGRYEVRWELDQLAPGVIGTPLQGTNSYVATMSDPIAQVLDDGVVATVPGQPWSTTVTVPADVEPGSRLVVNASCWNTAAAGGEEQVFRYFYLQVFLVTNPDGSVPPSSTPEPTTGTTRPAPPAPAPVPAVPQPGRANFTG